MDDDHDYTLKEHGQLEVMRKPGLRGSLPEEYSECLTIQHYCADIDRKGSDVSFLTDDRVLLEVGNNRRQHDHQEDDKVHHQSSYSCEA